MKRLLCVLALLIAVNVPLRAQGVVLPYMQEQFFQGTGVPAVGYKLCAYASGTTTLQPMYSDVGLTTPLNPLIFGSGGLPTTTAFVNPGLSYLYILKSAGTDNTCATGVTLWSRDSVSALGSGGAVLDCSGFSSGSASQKIAACIAALPTTGGTADARKLKGAQTWNTDPFSGVTKPVQFLCGAQTFTMSANTTAPTNVKIEASEGCVFSPNNAITLTINGSLEAPTSQIFSGAGTITFGGSQVRTVRAEWWNTNASPGTTDMTTALTTAANTGYCVDLLPTVYGITGTNGVNVTVGDSCIRGAHQSDTSRDVTVLRKIDTGGAVMTLSGQRNLWENLTVDGHNTADYGIHLAVSGGIQGQFNNIVAIFCTGTPGTGFELSGTNHSVHTWHLKSIENKYGVRQYNNTEENVYVASLVYHNSNTEWVIDGTNGGACAGCIIPNVTIIGGLVAAELPGTHREFDVNNVEILNITDIDVETFNAPGSLFLNLTGTSKQVVNLHGDHIFGNNTTTNSIEINCPVELLIEGTTFTANLGPAIHESGVAVHHITWINSLDNFASNTFQTFNTNAPIAIGTALGYVSNLVANETIGGTDLGQLALWNTVGNNTDQTGIIFGAGSSPYLAMKGAIIFQRNSTSNGRGILNLCTQNTADNSNVAVGDCAFHLNPQGKVGIGATATTTEALTVGGAIFPNADNTISLGGSSNRWLNLYVTAINSGGTNLTLSMTSALLPVTDNNLLLGNSSFRWGSMALGTSLVMGGANPSLSGYIRSSNNGTSIVTVRKADNMNDVVMVGVVDGSNNMLFGDGVNGAALNLRNTSGIQSNGTAIADSSGNLKGAGGATTIYRCTSAGTLRSGELTSVSGDCGTSVDSGIRTQ